MHSLLHSRSGKGIEVSVSSKLYQVMVSLKCICFKIPKKSLILQNNNCSPDCIKKTHIVKSLDNSVAAVVVPALGVAWRTACNDGASDGKKDQGASGK